MQARGAHSSETLRLNYRQPSSPGPKGGTRQKRYWGRPWGSVEQSQQDSFARGSRP